MNEFDLYRAIEDLEILLGGPENEVSAGAIDWLDAWAHDALAEIARLRTALAAREWISVDNPPKNEGEYQVVEVTPRGAFVGSGEWRADEWWVPWFPSARMTVTHWMPLPAAPVTE